MKHSLKISLGLFLMFGWAKAQLIEVPIGVDSLIYKAPGSRSTFCWGRSTDSCGYGWNGLSKVIPPFFVNTDFDGDVHFIPQNDSIFQTYVTSHYHLITNKIFCSCPADSEENITTTLRAKGYYDNAIKIGAKNYGIFLFDTLLHKYRDATVQIQIFNNKLDSATFTDWKLIQYSSSSVTLSTVYQDSLPTNPVQLSGLSFNKNIRIKFTTSLPPDFQWRTFAGAIQTTAHFSGKDSICIIPVVFEFSPIPKSGVENQNLSGEKLIVFPNPSNGSVTMLSAIPTRSSLIHLHIFDELGRDVMAVFDGMMNETQKQFSIKLPQGIYYARMEMKDGVITKKIVIE